MNKVLKDTFSFPVHAQQLGQIIDDWKTNCEFVGVDYRLISRENTYVLELKLLLERLQ
ncbi:hypothetical protein OAP63_05975 [Vibrio sp.]|nr:hypothetical protein [Vibrio sp.]